MTTSTRDTQLELRDLSSNTEYIVTVVTVSGERWSEPVVIKEYTGKKHTFSDSEGAGAWIQRLISTGFK